MGLLLSVLFSYVGAIELLFVLRDVTHQVALHQQRRRESSTTTTNKDETDLASDLDLMQIQQSLRSSLLDAKIAELQTIDTELMQDGVEYENGYRVTSDTKAAGAAAERWNERRRELMSVDETSASEALIRNERNGEERPPPEIHLDDGDEAAAPSEEYLRSLDGIKFRPIVRDDGSGRRRAFKKRQTSNSSTESGGDASLRSSREEELRMFTSLEEEEFKQRNSDYTPIQYSSDPSLKVKNPNRRHKRSPAKDDRSDDADDINMDTDPWGDVQPKNYHDSELWRKEQASAIVEEAETEVDPSSVDRKFRNPHLSDLAANRGYSPVGDKNPKMSSFEDATDSEYHSVAASVNDVPNSNAEVDKENRKGKNVSNDDDNDDDNAGGAAACAELKLSNESLTSNSKDNDDDNDSDNPGVDELKINEFISYIEHLNEDGATGTPNTLHEMDKFEFKEYLELPKRIRHTSYNYDDDDDVDKQFDDIIMNIDQTHLVERVATQEEQLRHIQAEIERINNSLTPITRDILSPTNLITSTITTTKTSSSSTFIEHERITEKLTTIRSEQNPRTVSLSAPATPNYVATEQIFIDQPSPMIDVQFPLLTAAYVREESFTSTDSRKREEEDELEYIQGRQEHRFNSICEQIESDEYHHRRRHSETAETLEYIRGRDDWAQHQATAAANQHHMPIIVDDCDEFNIRDQIDSDEYHHARRVSECLDLAYGHASANLLFVAQGSARNGRARSPYKILRSNIDKAEMIERYGWKGATNDERFERSVSEGPEWADEQMPTIHNDAQRWTQRDQRSRSPITIRILVEHAGEGSTEDRATIVELSSGAESADEDMLRHEPNWDLEQRYEDDTSEYGETPTSDIVEIEVWNESQVVDEYVDEAIEIIENEEDEEAVAVVEDSGFGAATEPEPEATVIVDDKVPLKKSKTTRNLIDVERLSVDLSNNEAALSMIAAKTSEFLKNEAESGVWSMESNRSSDSVAPAEKVKAKLVKASTSSPSSSKEQREKRTSSFSRQENIDDLVQETSMGKWFHK